MSRPNVPPRATRSPFFGYYADGGKSDVFLCAATVTAVAGSVLAIATAMVSDTLWPSASIGIFAAIQTVMYATQRTLALLWFLVVAYCSLIFRRWEVVVGFAIVTITVALVATVVNRPT